MPVTTRGIKTPLYRAGLEKTTFQHALGLHVPSQERAGTSWHLTWRLICPGGKLIRASCRSLASESVVTNLKAVSGGCARSCNSCNSSPPTAVLTVGFCRYGTGPQQCPLLLLPLLLSALGVPNSQCPSLRVLAVGSCRWWQFGCWLLAAWAAK